MDRLGPADLVQRIQAAALAAAAQIAVQRLRRLPELRRGQVVDRVAKVRVIEDVEEVGARLQPEALAEGEAPLQEKSICQASKPRRALARLVAPSRRIIMQ